MDQIPIPRVAAEAAPRNPTREEYRRWAERQPRGRFERVWGRVVAMNAERLEHIAVKMRAWQALDAAVRAAGLPCRAFGDGATVEVGDHTDYEPDVVVTCSAAVDLRGVVAPEPVVVVEVTSPSTQSVDAGDKLADYFRVPSVRHYLMVRIVPREVVHHHRVGERVEMRVVAGGRLRLDPPGLTITVEDLFADLPPA